MNRSQLIKRLAAGRDGLGVQDSRLATLALLGYMYDALVTGDRLEIRNFGVLDTQLLTPKHGRNPRTGETVWLGHRRRARFKMAKNLRRALNGPGA